MKSTRNFILSTLEKLFYKTYCFNILFCVGLQKTTMKNIFDCAEFDERVVLSKMETTTPRPLAISRQSLYIALYEKNLEPSTST